MDIIDRFIILIGCMVLLAVIVFVGELILAKIEKHFPIVDWVFEKVFDISSDNER